LGIVAPLLVGYSIYQMLIVSEQFGIFGSMGNVRTTDDLGQKIMLKSFEGKWFREYNEEIVKNLKLYSLGKESKPTESDVDNTMKWFATIIANTPMMGLKSVNEQLEKIGPNNAVGATINVLDAKDFVSAGKTSMIIAGVFGLIRALCLLFAGVCCGIFSYFCAKKNACLLQMIHTPASMVSFMLFMAIIMQVICTDYMNDLKDGKAYYAIIAPALGREFSTIKTNVFVYLPIPMILAITATITACLACDPVEDDEENSYVAVPLYEEQQFQPVPQYQVAQQQPQYVAAPMTTTTTTVEETTTTTVPVGGAVTMV
jgi:hypothetical protein